MAELPKKIDDALKNYYKLFSMLVAGMYLAITEELGEEEGNKLLVKGFRETGRLWGEANSEYSQQSGSGDAKSFAEAYLGNIRYYGFEADMERDATPNRAVVRIFHCPILDTLKPLGIADKICDRTEHELDDATARYVNPKLKLTVTKSLARGDAYCEYIYELER
jgi:predicted hydrocarbon binding protein